MSGCVREALPDVQVWSEDPRGCPGGPTGCTRVVGMLSVICERGQDALGDFLEWSGVPSGCPVVVGSPSGMSGSGRESLPDVR